MAIVNRSFSVNVTPGMMPPIVHVSEYDVGRAYTVSILDEQGNTFTIPSGTTVSIEGTLNGSVGFTQSATVSNNQVSFTLSESMTAYSGKAWCKIKLTQNSQPIQTCAFVLAVDRAGVEAGTVIGAPNFQEQINSGVAEYFDGNPPFFVLPSGGQSGQALLSDGAGGAVWGAAQSGGTGLSDDAKAALLACFRNVAWIGSDGQDYYDDLYDALYPTIPPATLLSISASFNQGSAVIYDTDSLDTLKQYLVVTANYSNQTTQQVTSYTLSGTLAVGTSTITVSYGGKTDTFNVTVTESSLVPTGYTKYDYIKYTGADGTSISPAKMIRTKKFDNLNNLAFDFDFMPTQAKTTATAVLGGQKSGTTGSGSMIVFYSRTDSKRVSVFSHGTALGINDIPNVAVNSIVHVNLNPGTSSPSVLTVDTLTDSQAWTNTNTIDSEIAYCGNSVSATDNTLANYAAVGILRLYDVTASNALVGEYVPCVRQADNVIGLYDTVTATFYTASTESYATIGNSNCIWDAGNWED